MVKEREGLLRLIFVQDFLNRAMAILIGLFLLQFVQWMVKEPDVWQDTTALLVKITLIIVGLSYLIPRIPYGLRIVIQMIAILIVHGVYLKYKFVPLEKATFQAFMTFWEQNTYQLTPYIFFSIGAWFIYVIAIVLMVNKRWLFTLIVLAILILCTRDSFSNLTLWQEVAGVMVTGSLLFVINHIQNLKKQAPETVTKLSKKPMPFLIPVACLSVICWLIIVYSPTMAPVLKDPYTAWKQYNGESVQKFIDETGVSKLLNFGSASSGYSRDDSKLGGGFQFDYGTVMTVKSPQRAYMRGETRSTYTGAGWEKSSEESFEKGADITNGQPLSQDEKVDQSLLKTREITGKVTVDNSKHYPVLFGPASILSISEQQGQDKKIDFSQIGWTKQDEVLHYIAKDNYPNQYQLISSIPIYDPEELRKVDVSTFTSPKWNTYLSLPQTLPARVKELAVSLTSNVNNPYDKVKVLERYLAEKHKYTSTPDVKKGKSKDFVDAFLFEIQEGYCDYFSTSMVVMARSIGMPARWVKGFSSGVSESEQIQEQRRSSAMEARNNPDGEDTYTIRNADAHSWAEIYFPGHGWVPFEATAGFALPTVFDPSKPIVTQEAPEVEQPETTASLPTPTKWVFWVTTCAVIAAFAVIMFYLYKRYGSNMVNQFIESSRQKRFANNYNKIIQLELNRLLKYSRRKGYVRHEHETMRETLLRWSVQSKWLSHDLEKLLGLFEKSKYSCQTLTRDDWVTAHKTILKLRTAMK
ncbi:transglutaminase domain-containing protein [Paenibacillus sp. N1-5-1-14]|uniref:DUF4129 domain-containing transglutaminase family protein n=1 Tax=Paenibacillus radicibacter TaxID=2972488 RepID=UPI0021591D6A|nr:transglutaminase domain-containing protein [Paenibacillus radicibacter]MCR8645738.1 transglutaminase domain-containing protein [Paenibacillus radicibacter]